MKKFVCGCVGGVCAVGACKRGLFHSVQPRRQAHPILAYMDLQYAVSDAQRIIYAFKEQEGNRFDNVHTRLITDNEATKQNILYNIGDFF